MKLLSMNTIKQFWTGIIFIAFSACSTHAIPIYNLTNLGNLGGQSTASALNNEGQVVGSATLSDGSLTSFLWQESTGMVNIGILPGDNEGGAVSINDAGQITGSCQGSSTFQQQGFLWQTNSGMIDIGTDTNTVVAPFGINQKGQIFGTSNSGGFIYSTSNGFALATIPGTTVDGIFALNGIGQMVIPNHANNDIGFQFYSPGQGLFSIQNSVGWDVSAIAGMNEQGVVTGTLISPITDTPLGFIWDQADGMTILSPNPNEISTATGINDMGQVVGGLSIDGAPAFPFLYENGSLYNLLPYLDNTAAEWTNIYPTAINDNGDIAGYGLYNGQEEAFLLTPDVPEPALAASVAGIGLRRRKRKIQNP